MKILYFINVAILSFSLVVLAGTLRLFAAYPEVFYTGLVLLFVVLAVGVLPYRVRSRNPFMIEFLTMLGASILGVILWF